MVEYFYVSYERSCFFRVICEFFYLYWLRASYSLYIYLLTISWFLSFFTLSNYRLASYTLYLSLCSYCSNAIFSLLITSSYYLLISATLLPSALLSFTLWIFTLISSIFFTILSISYIFPTTSLSTIISNLLLSCLK